MKALSVHEPFASYIARGIKRYETRSWKTKERGLIAIHAAKRFHQEALDDDLDAFSRSLARHIDSDLYHTFLPIFCALSAIKQEGPPHGIVAVGTLRDCIPTKSLRPVITDIEYGFGDFSDGRFGWEITGIKRLECPIPYRGQQGLFEVPDDIFEGRI